VTESITARLHQAAAAGEGELDRVCEAVATELVDAGLEPPFPIPTADFAADVWLICADRYWRRRLLAEPTVEVAASCAHWLATHADASIRPEIAEKWTMGYGFITRDTVDSTADLTAATGRIVEAYGATPEVCAFAALYHAAKLRANFWFDELHTFLESSLLAVAAGDYRDQALVTALHAFAVLGRQEQDVERGLALLAAAWDAAPRSRTVLDVCLHGLDVARPFPGHGAQLCARAEAAVLAVPDGHLFYYRLARGRRRTGEFDAARKAIDTALRLLPAAGSRVSHEHLQERYLAERDAIEAQRAAAAAWEASQHARPRPDMQILDLSHREAWRLVIPATIVSAALMMGIALSTAVVVTSHHAWSVCDRALVETALWILLLLAGAAVLAGVRLVSGRGQDDLTASRR